MNSPPPNPIFLSHIYWLLSQTNLAVFIPLRYSPISGLVCFYHPPPLFEGMAAWLCAGGSCAMMLSRPH